MKHLRWQALIALLGLLLAVGLLSGQSREVIISEVPVAGTGTYREALIGAPRALNPLLDVFNPVDRDLDRLIFSGLTHFDAQGRPVDDLANWFLSSDERTYTFILKPNLTWHDGAPLTAEDVAFTVQVLQNPTAPGLADLKQLWQAVSVAVTGTQTIAFTLPEPFAPFLDFTDFGVLPKHLLADVPPAQMAQAAFNLQPVGSGPFRFVGWQAAAGQVTGVTLAAYERYHGVKPILGQIEFRFYPNGAAALAAYEAGEVLGVAGLSGAEVAPALRLPDLRVYSAIEPEYTLIFLNLRDETLPFFKDKKVRQALALGLNRSAMVSDILNGQAVPANSPIVPGSWAYNAGLPPARYDPAAAAALLDSAGWVVPPDALAGTPDYVRQKDGVTLAFTMTVADDATHRQLAAAAQQTWAGLGLRVEIDPVAPAALRSQALEPRAYQALLADFSLAGNPDPDPYPLWHQTQVESGQNYGGWDDRIASQVLEQARITADIGQRARLYQTFQTRFMDQTPALLLYYPVYSYGVDAQVGGVQLGPLTDPSDRFASLSAWSLVTRRVVIEQTTPTP
ncbi:MAG: peptide ABC transporter substrate-binding protein [Anaerolineales bacterium]|nr:peptide ABC transporter substrate-binding protein [Anaerolineales bacterium]